MQNTEEIWRLVEAKKDDFEALSDRIWGMPELCYGEFRSCAEHTAMLEQQGFRVTKNLAGIPTAVMGEAGQDGPVIAILGEYDALPGLSQEAGVAEPRPLAGDGYGHGCGHNLLGSASMLAATAVKDYLAAQGIKGRVRYYGCPAEEGGAAKGFMARAGAFSDVDVAISWHPAAFAGVTEAISLANTRIDFTFHGRASHAAAAPHLGRSALDAVELMSVGVNYMREHMPSDARVHYALLDAGGTAPNVVQARAKVRYLIRARELPELWRLIERVRKIADGAALMSETRVESQVVGDAERGRYRGRLSPGRPTDAVRHIAVRAGRAAGRQERAEPGTSLQPHDRRRRTAGDPGAAGCRASRAPGARSPAGWRPHLSAAGRPGAAGQHVGLN
jgi:aminobenzoyl-glutamate utilization protein B